ncbi:MAG TPA: hypothetical protein VES03_03565 [Motilibacterales bacterium]|nr:hypothetical protein [Motilibacterales bacterium]
MDSDLITRSCPTFTGRRVVNDIRASLVISDGLIHNHRDTFVPWAWSRQAHGTSGVLLRWTPFLQGKVRGQAMAGLQEFQPNG